MNGTIWDSEEPGPSLTTNKGEGYKIACKGHRDSGRESERPNEDTRQGEHKQNIGHHAPTTESVGGGGYDE